jgi:UDP-3-O-[3-hydroxymyristoyl] glucosamine N-acyltransferase
MIPISQVIGLLNPAKISMSKDEIFISEPIALNLENQRDDVLMWVSMNNINAISTIEKGVIICPNIAELRLNVHCNYLFVEHPRRAFSLVLKTFFLPAPSFSIAKSAVIDPSVSMGKNIYIGENVVIEKGCQLGNNVKIGHNSVILAHTVIKNDVIIGSNCVIGSVGFGYEKDENGQYEYIPHIGNVIIENSVEIGNCTTIDRAVLGSTIIRKNVKIDNLVHIAHGVEIGENSLIIANALIGGSTKIGKNVWVAPSSSIMNKAVIGDNVVIGLGAVVLKSVAENQVVVGNPAKTL